MAQFGEAVLHLADECIAAEYAETAEAVVVVAATGEPRRIRREIDLDEVGDEDSGKVGAIGLHGGADECGAELEYVPMLLGALFKAIGTPMVPLFTFCWLITSSGIRESGSRNGSGASPTPVNRRFEST